MYCVKCGQQLSETSKFCNQCGTPVTRAYTAQKGVRPPAPPHAKVRGNKKLALWLGVGLPALAVLVFLGLWLGPLAFGDSPGALWAPSYAGDYDTGLDDWDGSQPLTVTRDPTPPALRTTNAASVLALRRYICARLKTEAFITADFSAMTREEADAMVGELAALWKTALELSDGAEFTAGVAQLLLEDEASRTAMGGLRITRLAAHSSQYPAVALDDSDYMEWAEHITAIYDAHEGAGKLRSLAAELGTDARTALERLTMAQQIIRDGALADADYYNTMTNIARGVKTGCSVALFAASTVASGGGSLVALAGSSMTVAEAGAFIVGGVSCIVDVSSTGSTIILGEDNQVTASADKVQTYLGPISYTIGLATFNTAELGDQIAYIGDSVLDVWLDGKILGVEVIPDGLGSWVIKAQVADALGLNQHETADLIRDMGFVPPEEQDATIEELLGDYTMNEEEALAEMGALMAAAMEMAANAGTDPFAVPGGQSPDVPTNHSGVPTLDEMVGTYDGEITPREGPEHKYPVIFTLSKTDEVTGFMRYYRIDTGEPSGIEYPFTYSGGVLTMNFSDPYAKAGETWVTFGEDGRVTVSWASYDYLLGEEPKYFENETRVIGVRRNDPLVQQTLPPATDHTAAPVQSAASDGVVGNATINSLAGMWYDIEGVDGTLNFAHDDIVFFEGRGSFIELLYIYDKSSGTGKMWIPEKPDLSYEFFIEGGLLITGYATYTRDYVKQIDN